MPFVPVTIDLSGRGGLAPRFFGDVNNTSATHHLRYLGDENQLAEGCYNPFRRYGYLSPATDSLVTVTAATNSFADVIRAVEYDVISGKPYFAENNGQLWIADDVDDVTWTRDRNVANATYTDLAIYQVNGVRTLFYAYQESGTPEGRIGKKNLATDTYTDNWCGTGGSVTGTFGLAASKDYKLIVADNSFMYALDGNAVHKFDGTTNGGSNGTATANVLVFPVFFNLIDGIDTRGNIYILLKQHTNTGTSTVNFNSPVGVYVWDRQSSQVSMRDYIPLQGVSDAISIFVSPIGSIRVVCLNSRREVEIREFNGSSFDILSTFAQTAYPRFRDSITNANLMTYFMGNNGIMYGYGKVDYLDPREGTFHLGNLATAANSNPGAILYGGAGIGGSIASGTRSNPEAFYISFGSVSNRKWLPHGVSGTGGDFNFTNAIDAGNVYTLVKYLSSPSFAHYAHIYCLPTASTGVNTVGTIKVYYNNSSTVSQTFTVTRNDTQKGYAYLKLAKSNVTSIQFEIEFESSSNFSTSEFNPSYAVVQTEPTTRLT